MPCPMTIEVLSEIDRALSAHGYQWTDLIEHCAPVQDTPKPKPVQDDRADVSSQWVKAAAEAILQSNTRLTTNAQTFVAQTFARASQYDTVKFSPKQWEWFNKIMLSAGVEAVTLEGNDG